MNNSIDDKRKIFHDLHNDGCFILPNPWDVGSAKLLENLGFKALATTSSGYSWSCGKADGHLSRDETLAHLRQMVQSSNLPINADFESGFSDTTEGMIENIKMALNTGIAGISIEDSTGNIDDPLRCISDAVERIQAARIAIDQSGENVMLIGRAENFFVGVPNLEDTIIRLKAYSEAGADCLYAPGIKTREQIIAVVNAVLPKPVNVLIGWDSDLTVSELEGLGVRRISLGGALARTALDGFIKTATTIAKKGTFHSYNNLYSNEYLNNQFK
ncbi:isocitrate lyase/PEP mutase family protein [Acinetobacter nectaris]|uniref:isocitrate lyase/PEP mutase family protein n=1 Tax=Acinetobacter nectaris TaxID=1219382 RepID=UPI001F491A6C|nr:isocitrate lyase/phosphoenolpyruvate mutase family protein [Acinetobacter nectaris]MCF9035131.1 isocitrate lyase/phosphoenolpyruvate mutase family protein [Acinetobacter nectaris]